MAKNEGMRLADLAPTKEKKDGRILFTAKNPETLRDRIVALVEATGAKKQLVVEALLNEGLDVAESAKSKRAS